MIPKSGVDVERTLESTWALQAPLEQVWAVLSDLPNWPRWWPSVQTLQLVKPGRADGAEALYRLNGHELRVCEVRPPDKLECHTNSVLARWGLWHEEGNTFVHLSVWGYNQEARFAQAMSAGARGLAEHLGVKLVEAGSWSAATDPSMFP
jgi:uncharacterized protein YndB with AHSA1/START domain